MFLTMTLCTFVKQLFTDTIIIRFRFYNTICNVQIGLFMFETVLTRSLKLGHL